MSERTTIEVSEELHEWVEETFGEASMTKTEMYRMALWYARHKHEIEISTGADAE